jgi:ATP-dependent Clp protease ATP-binding subunit ClpC
MKVVEQAVRPVSSSTPRKRKMREELLAHLTTIYEEEFARCGEPAAALSRAARRFGEPAELAREFQSSLPFHERVSYFTERFVAYRAPESAARYSLRMACHTFVLLAAILSVVGFGVYLRYGWIDDLKLLFRVLGAIVVVTPPAQFVIWLAYIKLRDAMWGAFGSRKSLRRVFLYGLLTCATAELYLMGVAGIASVDFGAALQAASTAGWISAVSAMTSVCIASLSGPSEIRDTQWALLEIDAG